MGNLEKSVGRDKRYW